MALDSKLKSEITNASPDSKIQDSQTVSDSISEINKEGKALITENTKENNQSSHFNQEVKTVDNNLAASNEIEELFKSIEDQLVNLNQKISDLEETYNNHVGDYSEINSKIDSVAPSIKKMVSDSIASFSTEKDQYFEKIDKLELVIKNIAEKQDRNDKRLAQTLRENANFQIQVRQGMQNDIEILKEQQRGDQFNYILKEIATIYVENQILLESQTSSENRDQFIEGLFEQLEDLLMEYDSEIQRSEIGTVRQTRSSKIINKILTGDEGKHNTVAKSRQPGVVKGKAVLYPEFIDVYIYDSNHDDVIASEEISSKNMEEENQPSQMLDVDVQKDNVDEEVTKSKVEDDKFYADIEDSTKLEDTTNSLNEE